MKEILDTLVVIGFVYILFIFLRGMNETQVQKHKEKLDKSNEKNHTLQKEE
ncbi:MAG: hypothetical protein IE909_01125 [Campylobacterales bacterium]|nr:hypothetical protein [Campylobacterales bacterium]